MKVTIQNENMSVAIELKGAQLTSIQGNGREYLWQGDAKYWKGQAPLLFPAIGSYENNKIQINGQMCEMGNHGFLKDMEFEVLEQYSDKVVMYARWSEQTLNQYPFRFQVIASYEVNGSELLVSYEIGNLDEQTMVYNFGLHPALNCNVQENTKFEDYYVEFDKVVDVDSLVFNDDLRIELNQTHMIKENTNQLELEHSLFYRTIIMKDISFSKVWLGNQKEGRFLEMEFGGFDIFSMWQPDSAPFICLEPWNGIDGIVQNFENLEESPTVQRLLGGETKQYTLKFTVL